MAIFLKSRYVAILSRKTEALGDHRLQSCRNVLLISVYFRIAQNPRSYASERTAKTNRVETSCSKSFDGAENGVRATLLVKRSAAAALLDYFHGTRGLPFVDAENMSRNAPRFMKNILKKIILEEDVQRSVTRFLRYHPVNEFEAFFESLGLKPSKYLHLLPRDKMFLAEDPLLLENHMILCNYGVSRKQIGRIYKEFTELFQLGNGVLTSKIQAYEDLGFSKSLLVKVFACIPDTLVGDINKDFVEVLKTLKDVGVDSLAKKNLTYAAFYDWSKMNQVLSLFREMGFCEDQLCGLVNRHQTLVSENSGELTLALIGFQTKLGLSTCEMFLMFQQFPQIRLGEFFKNLRKCFLFLNEIEMKADEIGKTIRSNILWLGTCRLKKTTSILRSLKSGKKRLCQIIQKNPQEMKKWVMGSMIEALGDSEEAIKSRILKTKFLIDLGYAENSKELEKAHKIFNVKGPDLQERVNLLLERGLSKNDVMEMVKSSSQIICQSREVLGAKIDYLKNDLGFSVSELVRFPTFLSYTTERVKLRFLMYYWLREKGKVDRGLALSTVLVCSEKNFFKRYVTRHEDGPVVWVDLKNKSVKGIRNAREGKLQLLDSLKQLKIPFNILWP